MWYVVDEFGFEMSDGYQTEEEAKNSRNIWENTEAAKLWNLKYEIEFREN